MVDVEIIGIRLLTLDFAPDADLARLQLVIEAGDEDSRGAELKPAQERIAIARLLRQRRFVIPDAFAVHEAQRRREIAPHLLEKSLPRPWLIGEVDHRAERVVV